MKHARVTILRRVGLLYYLVFAGTNVFPYQSSEIELASDTASSQYLMVLAGKYAYDDQDKALQYVRAAETIATTEGDSLRILKAIRLKSQILFFAGRLEEADSLLNGLRSGSLIKQDKQEAMYVANILASVHVLRAEYDRGLPALFDALDLAEELKDADYLSTVNTNLGLLYYKLSDYRRAVSCLLRAKSIDDSIGDVSWRNAVNLSLCYAYLDDFTNSKRYLLEASADSNSVATEAKVHIEYAAGVMAFRTHDLRRAIDHFSASLKLARALDDRRMIAEDLCLLAEAHWRIGELSVARRYLQLGEVALLDAASFRMEKLRIYRRLGELHAEMGNFEDATRYQRRFIALNDSIYSDAQTTNLMRIEADFVERHKEKQIEMQKALLSSKEDALRWQKRLNSALIVVAMLVLACLTLFYRDIRRAKRVKAMLQQAVQLRTQELERQHVELGKRMYERDLFLSRILDRVQQVSQRILGLVDVAEKEVNKKDVMTCLRKISQHSASLKTVSKGIEALDNSGSQAREPGRSAQ